MVVKKGGERIMELLKRLVVEEEGQGLVEYTLIVLLVALVFWVAVKGTNADQALTNAWTSIVNCLNAGTVLVRAKASLDMHWSWGQETAESCPQGRSK